MERILVSNGTAERSYLLLRPQQPGPSRPPLLLFLTGTGGTAEWTADECRLEQLVEESSAVVVVPEATRPKPEEPVRFLTNPPRWNDGSTAASADFQVTADDVQFLTHVITDALARTDADPRRVFVSGFSNGAGMTFRLAAERAELIAGIVPVAGLCAVEPPVLVRPVPTLYILGTADPLIPLRGGDVKLPWGGKLVRRPSVVQTLETWARAIGCTVPSQLVSDTDGVRTERFPGPVLFDVFTLDGLGHHWPGGKGRLNPRLAGPNHSPVAANRLIREFIGRTA